MKDYLDKASKVLKEAKQRVENSELVSNSVNTLKDKYDEYSPIINRASEKITKTLGEETLKGGALGAAAGYVVAGTGGMGIVALGGAVGVPFMLVSTVVGGVGGRFLFDAKKIKDLQEANAEARDGEHMLDKGLAASQLVRIVGKEAHDAALLRAFEDSKETLCIRSGWVSKTVINDKMLELMDKTLSRGVCIYIETGWKSSINPYSSESEHHKMARQRLLHLQEKYRSKLAQDVTSEVGQLIFAAVKTHIKEVIVDGQYYIAGSNNWLSNQRHFNKEASHIIRLPHMARLVRDETIASVLSSGSAQIDSNVDSTGADVKTDMDSETVIPKVINRKCPNCGSRSILPVVYGLVDDDFLADSSALGYVLGGCNFEPDEPKHACNDCKHRF